MARIRGRKNGDCSNHNKMQSLPAACDDSDGGVFSGHVPLDSFAAADGVRELRIGDEYQAELPPLVENYSCKSYLRNSTDREVKTNPHQNFVIGLPLPLIGINGQNHESLETVTDSNGIIKPLHCSVEPEILRSEEIIQKSGDEVLVPGLLCEHWGDAEKASFLLALYIFGKNFVELRRFVETRTTGVVLAYYYGEFYGSKEYKRWSEYRKTKTKKCVYGQRLFSGLRLKKLLSRILARVSEESKSALQKVSTAFGKQKISLAEYVSALKAMVGMNVLVEAVGIGTGKQDLTGRVLEPSKSNKEILSRPEISRGKACSVLTNAEISKLLNGNFRLSKARTSDLFWEAVWPRLVANGWRLWEMCHCSVFLPPNTKKFSRRLLKDEQYYDSSTDVLSLVAREPNLLELKKGEAEHDKKEKRNSTKESHQSMDSIKFSAADESITGDQVQNLGTDTPEMSKASITQDGDEDMIEVGESDNINAFEGGNLKRRESGRGGHPGSKKRNGNPLLQDTLVHDSKKDMDDNKQRKKVSKSQLSQKQKESDLGAPSKRSWKSIANSHKETIGRSSCSSMAMTSGGLENGTSSCCTGTVVHESYQDLSSKVSSSKGSLKPGEGSSSITITPEIENGMSSCYTGTGIHESYPDSSSSVGSSKESPKADESIEHAPIDKSHSRDNDETRPLLDLNHASDDGEMQPLFDLNLSSDDGETQPLFDLNKRLDDGEIRPLFDLNKSCDGETWPLFDLNQSSGGGETWPLLDLNRLSADCEMWPLFDLNVPHVTPDLNLPHPPLDIFKINIQPMEQNDQTSNTEARSIQEQPNPPIPMRHSLRSHPPTARALEAVVDEYLAASPRRRRMERNAEGSNAEASPRPSRRARVSPAGDPNESNHGCCTYFWA